MAAVLPMTVSDEAGVTSELRRECGVFAVALTGMAPSEYVIGHYVRGHDGMPQGGQGEVEGLEERLLRAAARGGWQLRSADMYARFFLPGAVLRRKLVLLLAIMENSPGVHARLDTALVHAPASAVLRLIGLLLQAGLLLVAGVVRFGPVHALAGRGRARATERRPA